MKTRLKRKVRPPQTKSYNRNVEPTWKTVVAIGASVPDEDWARVPTDLSKNLDHYLYGCAKVEE